MIQGLRLGVVLAVCSVATPVLGQKHTGAEACGSCHKFAYERWKSGPHATAHQLLTEKQGADPKCNGCHSMIPMDTTAKFTGVQCESCHGAGQYYAPSFVMVDPVLARIVGLKDPTTTVCISCHTEDAPSVEAFDFEVMWSRIDHGKGAREAWEKRAEQAAAK